MSETKIHISGLAITFVLVFVIGTITSCSEDNTTTPYTLQPNCGESSALAECLSPQFSPEYYIDQGRRYFRTMQSDIPNDFIPNYSDLVVRWEWPPWLLLTGYTRPGLINTDILLKLIPTAYDTIDCRFFQTQPFCRCHVVFDYSGELCPIYEEFTFNDQGEITFIEAWSDFPTLLPMGPGEDGIWSEDEYWGKTEVNRLSTRLPGLGNETGRIDLYADYMRLAAENDPDLADMVARAKNPVITWMWQTITHQDEVDHGCEVPEGDVYPYYE